MTVHTSYPGLYIQEMPASAHTISAAPTSIAVFVGYSHPYKTKFPGQAVRIFDFSGYEASFGGLFSSGVVEPALPRAVYQFFANGGSDAYVVGLTPNFHAADGSTIGAFSDDQYTPYAKVNANGANQGIIFRALEPTDAVTMRVSVSNLRDVVAGTSCTFDVTVSYGTHVETYRGVKLGAGAGGDAPDTRINGASSLVRVAAQSAGFGTDLPALPPSGSLDVAFTW